MKRNSYFVLALLIAALVFTTVNCSGNRDNHDNHGSAEIGEQVKKHDAHDDHGDEHSEEDHDNHEEHSDDEHGKHADGHSEEEDKSHENEEFEHVELTVEQQEKIGLELAVAGSDILPELKEFPGEVVQNPDKVAHVAPRAEGIVREISKNLGDTVKAGEVLAWIESAELGDAKTEYLEKKQQLELARSDYSRAKTIHDNTAKLLKFLEKEPELSELETMNDLNMGENKGTLISAYSEYVYAKSVYEREKDLFKKEITSRNEYLEAENAFRQAEAVFSATRDEVAFSTERSLLETQRAVDIAELALKTADRNLHLLGMSEDDIHSLDNGGKLHSRMSYFPITAPISGSIAEKHITLGEKVSSEENVFTISDTSSVWVIFSVYQKDLSSVETGQIVSVDVGESHKKHEGIIDFVSPTVDEQTRTVQARISMDNSDGELRPGLYVKVNVGSGSGNSGIVIPRDAVQVLDEQQVVFIKDGDGFSALPVTLGTESNGNVIVKTGLKPGQRYVTRGAFELKAKLVTSGLGAHAGHGH